MGTGKKLAAIALALTGLMLAGGAEAAGPLGGVVGLPGQVVGDLGRTTGRLGNDLAGTVNGLKRDVVGRPLDRSAFDRDPSGARVLRRTVVAVAPSDADLAAARQLGFDVTRRDTLPGLGLDVAVLQTPGGMSIAEALAALRRAVPEGTFDYDHIYDPSGESVGPAPSGGGAPTRIDGRGTRIGMIDGGIARRHPAFARATLVVRNVASDSAGPVTAHGTAIASLLVGDDDDFRGCIPGATLYAADVFGGKAGGGGAIEIARALDWLAQSGVRTVNISLAGPPNKLLELAVRRFLERGRVIVAAVGNAGPAAPVAFPAGYEGVVGVTSVDSTFRPQLDAGRGDVAFAALGVDVRAAKPERGYASYTGTSFAAPVVSARFALALSANADARNAMQLLQRAARPLAGDRTAFGYGYLAPPAAVK